MEHPHWTSDDISPLHEKIALVTGANSGLGYHTALEARKGACVIMACRSLARSRSVLNQIQSQVVGAGVELMALDLASLASIRAFAEAVK